ncbi:MAG: dihydropteroate synthase [Planctomycetaceae bacterium]|nr:dihydropteroate synthase [Planctomycetaceae bacterium]
MSGERILFITGRLAEYSLRKVVAELSERVGFDYDVQVMGISVAALMHAEWLKRKLPAVPEGYSRAILPGMCQGEIEPLAEEWKIPVQLGPREVHDLPAFFGKKRMKPADYDQYDIEIIAEINHAPRLTMEELLRQAEHYRASGADVIDVGCIPGESWSGIGEAVRELREAGHRVSIDSFDREEVERGVTAGAELVLSCNGSNRDWAADLPVEWVVIPDDPLKWEEMEETAGVLRAKGRKYRLDPILEPIGFGFANGLGRYLETRKRWPSEKMMMGIGNVTELSEADTGGMNLLLAGFCQEQQITSVLTTEVINWGRSAVREFDLARRLVRYAVTNRTPPKHVDSSLVMLRDARIHEMGEEGLAKLAGEIRDANYRIFVERGELHLINREGHWHGKDPFELIEQIPPVDASHAFYLGYELSKGVTALTLGKQYRQDQALQWGFLTVPERSRHERGGAADRS